MLSRTNLDRVDMSANPAVLAQLDHVHRREPVEALRQDRRVSQLLQDAQALCVVNTGITTTNTSQAEAWTETYQSSSANAPSP